LAESDFRFGILGGTESFIWGRGEDLNREILEDLRLILFALIWCSREGITASITYNGGRSILYNGGRFGKGIGCWRGSIKEGCRGRGCKGGRTDCWRGSIEEEDRHRGWKSYTGSSKEDKEGGDSCWVPVKYGRFTGCSLLDLEGTLEFSFSRTRRGIFWRPWTRGWGGCIRIYIQRCMPLSKALL
jgi:hypothetical protein